MKLFMTLTMFLLSFNEAFAIRYGANIDALTHPSIVRIDNASGVCTGVRLNQKYILTVAHCLVPQSLSSRRFFVFEKVDGKIKKRRVKFTNVVINKENFSAEVAIISLKNKSFNESHFPQLFRDRLNLGFSYDFFGYGLNENGISKKLRKGRIAYTGNAHKEYGLEKNMHIFTAGQDNSLPCPGDSGGVVMQGNDVLSIVSFINNPDIELGRKTLKDQCLLASRAFMIDLEENREFIENYLY